MNTSIENMFVYAEFTKKKIFELRMCSCVDTPLKISLPKNEITVNLKSASFFVIMHLHKGSTQIQSQIKPQLLFGESFTIKNLNLIIMFSELV